MVRITVSGTRLTDKFTIEVEEINAATAINSMNEVLKSMGDDVVSFGHESTEIKIHTVIVEDN